jgi:GAF domain-containing protein/DNA-binding response OmpR family regulator/nitrogen-specific signal transduction histidine kinase
MALLLALGYGLFRAPAEWRVPLRLLLPVAVGALALAAGRVIAPIGALLAVAFLVPGLVRAIETAALAMIIQNVIVAVLCLLAGWLQPIVAALPQLQRRIERNLGYGWNERLNEPPPNLATDFQARRLEELAVLSEIAHAIGGSLDLRTTLETLLTSTRRLIDFDMAEVTLWEPARQQLVSHGALDAEAYYAEVSEAYRMGEGYSGWLAQHREPLLIEEIAQRQDVRPKLDRPDLPYRSYLGIPLERKGEFVGTLELMSCQLASFSPRDLEVLGTIGRQAAVAIDNARLYEETQRRAANLKSLAKVSATITSTLDLEEALDAIASSVLEAIGCQLSAIFVLDEEDGLLHLAATRGLSRAYVEKSSTLTIERGGRAHAVATGEPLIVEYVAADPALRPLSPLAEEEGFQAFADLPLRAGDRVIGMLSTIFDHPHYFDKLERDFLSSLADQAAVAIDNARLYTRVDRELQRRAVALSGLQRVGRELSVTFEQDHVLRLVMEETTRLSGATRAAILLKEPGRDHWQVGLCGGYLEEDQAALRRHLASPAFGAGPMGEVARTGQSLCADISEEEYALAGLVHPRSALLTPIWYGDAPAGIIMLESEAPDAFDEETLGFVEGLAAQAAIAIGNSRRYQEELARSQLLSRQAEQLSQILKVSQAVRSDQPLEDTLDEIAHAVQSSVGFDLVLISILEGDPPMRHRVAAAGIPVKEFARLRETPEPWQTMQSVILQEKYRISQSYYVPAEKQADWRGTLDVYESVREQEVSREPGQWHAQDILIVPLVGTGGEIRGTLSVDQPMDGQVPDRATIERLEVFAGQAAVAVENARLLEALERRIDLLTFFNELNRSVTAKRDLIEVLQVVVEATARIVQCDGSILFMLDEARGRYMPEAAFGHDLEALQENSFPSDKGLIGRVSDSGMPLTVTSDEMNREGSDCFHQGAAILVPLDIGGQVVGVLVADRKAEQAFVPADVATLIALADQVALAVQSARLFDETVERSRELSTLLEASSAISSTLDLRWVLQSLGDRLLTTAGAVRCHLSRWDREEDEVAVIWEVGEMSEDHSRVDTVYSADERPQAMTEVLLIQDPLALDADELWGDRDMRELEAETGAVLMLPMVARGRTVGLVELEQLSDGAGFTSDEVRLSQALANQAAVAIENAQLFEETRRFSEELEQRVEERTHELARALDELTVERDRVETLYEVAAELSSSLDLEQVLARTLEMLGDATGATRGTVLLVDQDTNQLFCRARIGDDAPIPPGGVATSLPRGQGLGWWVIDHGEPAIVEDVRDDPRWFPEGSDGHAENRRSCLAVPLGAGGQMQGALLLYHRIVDFFTPDHLRLVEAAGSQISNAISNANLYNLIREQANQVGAMLKQQRVEAAKSQAILEGVADGVMVSDDEGRVILFNAAAEHVLEIPREQVLGRSTKEMLGLYGSQGRSWLAAIDEWAANPRGHAPGDFTAEELTVGDRIVSVHVSPVIMGAEYLGTVSVFRDVTAEVEADRAKSEFVSTVSHELRTPMTSIKGYADLLLMGAVGELADQQEHFVTIIRNNADRLTALVNDLLDISRIETGRVELNLRAVSMSEVVKSVMATLEARAQERDLELRVDIPEDLPAVWGDSDRITQILTNLVGNAIQYTPSGGSICTSARVNQRMLEVAVADTGIGISEENLEKVFDRFFRADNPFVQETSGTGLGLAITTSLVRMHGGDIWVESEVGEGSTFSFTLPLARTMAEVAAESDVSLSVLVVEDDADVADLIRLHLESQGYQVVIAGRGDEALRLANEMQPDLITLDIRLPDADGFDVLRELSENPATKDIPVVIVSVVASFEESLRLGAVGYVGKPIDDQALLETVQRVLDQKGLILVVEDDQDNQVLIRNALKQEGFNVRTTRRGRRVLRMARESRPALILLDMQLEDMDGYQVLRNLKADADTQDIPIVVITGSLSQEQLRDDVLALGAARFLTKPFAVEELIHEITAVLVHPELQGELSR